MPRRVAGTATPAASGSPRLQASGASTSAPCCADSSPCIRTCEPKSTTPTITSTSAAAATTSLCGSASPLTVTTSGAGCAASGAWPAPARAVWPVTAHPQRSRTSCHRLQPRRGQRSVALPNGRSRAATQRGAVTLRGARQQRQGHARRRPRGARRRGAAEPLRDRGLSERHGASAGPGPGGCRRGALGFAVATEGGQTRAGCADQLAG